MTGAELMLQTARAGGVDICFANAGTTEIPIVEALDKNREIRVVLGLFEGVCTGAADGYGRLTGRPAMTLLHLGPGLANGIANLHNARRAGTPIFNVVGEHASWHIEADPPLAMDIAALGGTVSPWCRVISPAKVFEDTKEALEAAMKGQVATLVCPADYMWSEVVQREVSPLNFSPQEPDSQSISLGVSFLRRERKTALIIGGDGLTARGLMAAARIRAAVGCDLLSVTFPPFLDSGVHLPKLNRIPYFPRQARKVLAPYEQFLLVGTEAPVAFFGYRDGVSKLTQVEQECLRLDKGNRTAAVSLEALADALDAPPLEEALSKERRERLVLSSPMGKIDAQKLAEAIACVQPEGAIVVEEGLMSGFYYHILSPSLPPHSLITLTGGSIGMGMPASLGAALACPDRVVINIEADGSAMYTVQALWSQAREGVNVITIICDNGKYSTIGYEYKVATGATPGPAAKALIDLCPPAIDWVSLGKSMGVPALLVHEAQDLTCALEIALREGGPHLIVAKIG